MVARRGVFTGWVRALDPDPVMPGPAGSAWADAIVAIGAAAVAVAGRFALVEVSPYLKREGLLDIPSHRHSTTTSSWPAQSRQRCLPAAAAARGVSTRSTLFDAKQLLGEQQTRRVKTGVALSVRAAQWAAAEIYPRATNHKFSTSPAQVELFKLFSAG
ncbi:MAG: hypothetical protein ACRDSP_11025 [Pseudonocardiaceae bacterium]